MPLEAEWEREMKGKKKKKKKSPEIFALMD